MLFSIAGLFLVTLLPWLSEAAAPSGCTYSTALTSRGLYSCDFTIITLPLNYNAFSSPIVQRLRIFNINGQLPITSPTRSFNNFNSYSTANHDSDFTAYLELECSTGNPGGQLVIGDGTFYQMTHLEELHIKNCRLTGGLPEYVFSTIQSLNILTIEGGVIAANAANSLGDFNITVSTSLSSAKGILNFTNTEISGGTITSGFFYPVTGVEMIVLDNVGITSVDQYMFSQNTKLKSLIIRNNALTSVPNNMLAGLNALTYFDLNGISITCSCENVWFIKYVIDNNITLADGAVCTETTNSIVKNAAKYYFESCVTSDICDGFSGLTVSGVCYHWYVIVFFVLLLIAFLLVIITLILLIHTRKNMMSQHQKLRAKQTQKWSQIQEVLNKQTVSKQKPPAATLPPKAAKW